MRPSTNSRKTHLEIVAVADYMAANNVIWANNFEVVHHRIDHGSEPISAGDVIDKHIPHNAAVFFLHNWNSPFTPQCALVIIALLHVRQYLHPPPPLFLH
jgi:hypothetical protein